jgi:antitoxin component HigA of HigAB toxin-antitoxin module
MELRPIKTESDYQNALQEIERLFDAEPNSQEYNRLDILTTLVEAYEQKYYPIEAPDAISAILYYLESRGLSEQDLEDFEKLVELTNSSSKAEVFRRAIALLKIAAEAQAKGEKLMIADENRQPITEIVLP